MFRTDTGTGEPLLLLHGWGSDGGEWDQHVGPLAERYRVIVLDLPGHGGSPALPRTTPRTIAAALASELDGPVIAVGHSMGAIVVNILAIEHPDLVRAVVGVDPGYGIRPALAPYLAQVVEALGGDDPMTAALAMVEWCFTPETPEAVRDAHRKRVTSTPPAVLQQALAGIFTDADAIGLRPASEAYLARRACPALSIWADADRAAWEEPFATVVHVAGAGHYLHEERPTDFLDAVTTWLEGARHGTA
jgi:pimeloyl-ACP methyl ester carboxylesterase